MMQYHTADVAYVLLQRRFHKEQTEALLAEQHVREDEHAAFAAVADRKIRALSDSCTKLQALLRTTTKDYILGTAFIRHCGCSWQHLSPWIVAPALILALNRPPGIMHVKLRESGVLQNFAAKRERTEALERTKEAEERCAEVTFLSVSLTFGGLASYVSIVRTATPFPFAIYSVNLQEMRFVVGLSTCVAGTQKKAYT